MQVIILSKNPFFLRKKLWIPSKCSFHSFWCSGKRTNGMVSHAKPKPIFVFVWLCIRAVWSPVETVGPIKNYQRESKHVFFESCWRLSLSSTGIGTCQLVRFCGQIRRCAFIGQKARWSDAFQFRRAPTFPYSGCKTTEKHGNANRLLLQFSMCLYLRR